MKKPAQRTNARPVSSHLGENISTNPRSFTRDEKLETQNGIRNNLMTCQGMSSTELFPEVEFSSNAVPTKALIPREVSHILGVESKLNPVITENQIK